jgi:hypothetical protein
MFNFSVQLFCSRKFRIDKYPASHSWCTRCTHVVSVTMILTNTETCRQIWTVIDIKFHENKFSVAVDLLRADRRTAGRCGEANMHICVTFRCEHASYTDKHFSRSNDRSLVTSSIVSAKEPDQKCLSALEIINPWSHVEAWRRLVYVSVQLGVRTLFRCTCCTFLWLPRACR